MTWIQNDYRTPGTQDARGEIDGPPGTQHTRGEIDNVKIHETFLFL